MDIMNGVIRERLIEIGVDLCKGIDVQRDILARKFVVQYPGTSLGEINSMIQCTIEHDAHLLLRKKHKIEFSDLPKEIHRIFRKYLIGKVVTLTPAGHAHIINISSPSRHPVNSKGEPRMLFSEMPPEAIDRIFSVAQKNAIDSLPDDFVKKNAKKVQECILEVVHNFIDKAYGTSVQGAK